jgi:hypothetical protein
LSPDIVADVQLLRRQSTLVVELVCQAPERLEQALDRVMLVAKVLPLSIRAFRRALWYRDQYDIKQTQDAVILACVMADLERRERVSEKLLLSRDRETFASSGIRGLISQYNCKHIGSFDDGLKRIEAIGRGP